MDIHKIIDRETLILRLRKSLWMTREEASDAVNEILDELETGIREGQPIALGFLYSKVRHIKERVHVLGFRNEKEGRAYPSRNAYRIHLSTTTQAAADESCEGQKIGDVRKIAHELKMKRKWESGEMARKPREK